MTNFSCRGLRPGQRTLVFALALAGATTAFAERDPLDPARHSDTDSYRGDFDPPLVALDARLPWIEPFEPGGAFDPRFSLATAQSPAASDSADAAPSTAPAGLDAHGTVRDIRADAGKLKIEHGPIDRHGMPAMTMLFNIADPAMIEGLAKGDEIEFNVDMGASGFTITEIRRAGGSQ